MIKLKKNLGDMIKLNQKNSQVSNLVNKYD